MKLIFVRHAQATHNADALVRGEIAYFDPINTDAALTSRGLAQVSSFRKIIGCDYIYCSPSRRCRQTLLGIMPVAASMAVRLDDRLMEPQGEALCNKRLMADPLPAAWITDGIAKINPFDTVTERHQSREFYSRIRDFMSELVMTVDKADTVLIVSHHDWIRAWFSIYTGIEVSPANCEILTYEYPRIAE